MIMNCLMCKGSLENKLTTFMVELDNCIIIVKNVPSLVCKQCGEVSYSDEVAKQLDRKYKNVGNPLVCDAVKVAHHGSNGNCSHELMSRVSSCLYFIPGGKGEYPAWGTFGRVAINDMERGKKTIVFSHCCDMTQEMCSLDANVKEALNIVTEISDDQQKDHRYGNISGSIALFLR